MSTVHHVISIHDDIRPVVIRISRTEDGSEVTLQLEYLPLGTDSRDGPTPAVKTINYVYPQVYEEKGPPAAFPPAILQAAQVIGNYLEGKVIEKEFPPAR